MPSSHVLVQALHSIRPRQISEFLVHIMRARSRVVSEPDTEVLYFQRPLLIYLVKRKKKKKADN
jgi:hypothetical protein